MKKQYNETDEIAADSRFVLIVIPVVILVGSLIAFLNGAG